MQYDASIKSYEPDDEDSAQFGTWDEAKNWLLNMQPYHRNGGSKMVNGRRVNFIDGEMAYDDLKARKEREAAPSIAAVDAQFDRIFRPASARPVNPATLLSTEKLTD